MEYERNDTKDLVFTYIFPKLIASITATIWAFATLFFRLRIYMEMTELCPGGNMSAIGGKRKRNLQSLGKIWSFISYCICSTGGHNRPKTSCTLPKGPFIYDVSHLGGRGAVKVQHFADTR